MGAPQPRLREVSVPDVSKSYPDPLNLVLIQSQYCPSGTAIFRDRARMPHRAPTYPLGTELNRVSPSFPSYRINNFSVKLLLRPSPLRGSSDSLPKTFLRLYVVPPAKKQKEASECKKVEVVPAKVLDLFQHMQHQNKVSSMLKHIVIEMGQKICISKQQMKVCGSQGSPK